MNAQHLICNLYHQHSQHMFLHTHSSRTTTLAQFSLHVYREVATVACRSKNNKAWSNHNAGLCERVRVFVCQLVFMSPTCRIMRERGRTCRIKHSNNPKPVRAIHQTQINNNPRTVGDFSSSESESAVKPRVI